MKQWKMKIKPCSYEEAAGCPPPAHRKLHKPHRSSRMACRISAGQALKKIRFRYTVEGISPRTMKKKPFLVLMNRSGRYDWSMAQKILYPRPFFTAVPPDGFIGRGSAIRKKGGIRVMEPGTDETFLSDAEVIFREKKAGLLLYPEIGRSFDGTASPLTEGLPALIRQWGVPVFTIITHGAYLYDPPYGKNPPDRRVKVQAEVKCLFSAQEATDLPMTEIHRALKKAFSFDEFDWQYRNKISLQDDYRAEGLEKILYQCPACHAEGQMKSFGDQIHCCRCGKTYTMTEFGRMQTTGNRTEYPHIPAWCRFERDCVRRELEAGVYSSEMPVRIGMITDTQALRMIGNGLLSHDRNGFRLDGCEGKLHYEKQPSLSVGMWADYRFYDQGEVICLGGRDCLYCCFPETDQTDAGGQMTKMRMAAEEMVVLERRRRLEEWKREKDRRTGTPEDESRNGDNPFDETEDDLGFSPETEPASDPDGMAVLGEPVIPAVVIPGDLLSDDPLSDDPLSDDRTPDGDTDGETASETESDLSECDPSEIDTSEGDPSQGDLSEGDPSQGDPSQSNPSDGEVTSDETGEEMRETPEDDRLSDTAPVGGIVMKAAGVGSSGEPETNHVSGRKSRGRTSSRDRTGAALSLVHVEFRTSGKSHTNRES